MTGSETMGPANPLVDMGRAGRAMVVGTAALLLVGVAVGGIINETDQFPGIFAALLLYVATLLLPIYLIRDGAGWFHPLIYGSCFALLQTVRKAGSYVTGMTVHMGVPGFGVAELNSLMWQLLLIQALAQLAYCTGYLLGPKTSARLWKGPSSDPGMRLALIVAAVGVFFVLFLRNKGGLEEHMLDLGKGRVRQIEETQMFGASVVITNLATFALVALVAYARNPTHSLLIGLAGPAVLFMNYTVAGSRSSLVYTLMLCLIARSIATRRIRWTLYIVGGVTAVVAIGALGQIRRGTWEGSTGLQQSMDTVSTSESLASGLTEIGQRGAELHPVYAIMARVPEEVPYLMGKSYLTILTAPIPRALWMDKPRTTGALVGPTFFDSNAGMPPGAIGEALWNFGLPGVAVAFFVFGAIHRYMYAWFLNHPANSVAIVVYSLTLLHLQPDVLSFVLWAQMTFLGFVFCRLLGLVRTGRTDVVGVDHNRNIRPASAVRGVA